MTADQLKAWREKHRLTQVQAADALGVALITIKNWEAGRNAVSGPAAYLCAVADKIGVPALGDITQGETA
ncbi:helix-turn-helix domain-containing protein [Caballeronia zhejiangensis]|uniref:XRE family transcriptional regulator n=1 Tax=Caballeronia zhejiangensis TaxID=871203 RepID=A0A656QAW1_9BURK|nr:helix-turn-helix transcriptional regulator [Caballeronia zhejiangensis]KDR25950.1 XRE family transcriptional regulator [Caballeronia zhejiangensis]